MEDVKFFDHLDESANKSKKLYPVYIMLVHSGTTISNAIKFVSKSKFSHASISFDSSMDHMYSFARKDPSNPFLGGFRYESIGKGFYDKKEIPYALYVVPCTESQIKKMKKRLDYFIKNESKFQFDFAGLVKNYLGIADNPEYRWFCSRFVADILNAGAPKNKPYVAEPSLQDPDDFMRDEYATYVIGGDNLMKYNRALVDKRTRKIIREEEMARSVKNESVIYDMDWNNPYAESVLNYQLSCMDESVVHDFMNYLKSYKLKFDNDGNIIIRRREYDQLDAHFRASIKLIKASEKAGDWETVKAELAKLAQTFHSDCAIIIYPDLEKNDLLECLKLPFPTLFLGDFKEGDFPELSYNRIGSVINDFRDAVRFTRSREFHDLMLVLPDTLSGTVYFQNAIQEMEKKAEEQNVRIFYQWIPNARDCSKQVRLEGLKTAARRIRDSGMSSGLLFLDCVIYQEKFLEYLTAEGIVPRKGNLELLIGEAEEPDLYGEGIHSYRTQLESVAEFNRFLCDRLYDLAEGKLNNFHYNFNFQNQIRSWT